MATACRPLRFDCRGVNIQRGWPGIERLARGWARPHSHVGHGVGLACDRKIERTPPEWRRRKAGMLPLMSGSARSCRRERARCA